MARIDDEEFEELTTEELSTSTTDTGQFSKLQAGEWLDQVVLEAEPRRRFLDLSREFTELVGTGAKEITVPRTNKALDMSGDLDKVQGEDRNYTEMDTLDGETVTIDDDADWYEGGIKISKQKVRTTPVDVMEVARHHLAKQIARDVDTELYDEAVNGAQSVVASAAAGNEYKETDHSSGSHVVDRTESGRLTPDSIAEAAARVEANEWEPYALVISSDHKKDLRTDSQFTNAAEYGSDDVVLNGEIGMYLGIRVVVSNTVDKHAVMIGREQDTGADIAQALVWKEEPQVNHNFKFEDNTHRFYYDQSFKPTTVQPTALATIQTEA